MTTNKVYRGKHLVSWNENGSLVARLVSLKALITIASRNVAKIKNVQRILLSMKV